MSWLAVCLTIYLLGVCGVMFVVADGDGFDDDWITIFLWPLVVALALLCWPVLLKDWWPKRREGK